VNVEGCDDPSVVRHIRGVDFAKVSKVVIANEVACGLDRAMQ
jgi:hypothetical protein